MYTLFKSSPLTERKHLVRIAVHSFSLHNNKKERKEDDRDRAIKPLLLSAMSLLINHDFVFHPSKICILEFEGTCQLSRTRPLYQPTQKLFQTVS